MGAAGFTEAASTMAARDTAGMEAMAGTADMVGTEAIIGTVATGVTHITVPDGASASASIGGILMRMVMRAGFLVLITTLPTVMVRAAMRAAALQMTMATRKTNRRQFENRFRVSREAALNQS